MGFFSKIKERKEKLISRHYENKAKKLSSLRNERIKLEGRAKIKKAYESERNRINKAKLKTDPLARAKNKIKKKLKENKNKNKNYGKGIFY